MKRIPDFLSEAEIDDLHQVALEEAGGSDGLRDPGMLSSALAMPQAGFGDQFLQEDIPAMAAAYLYHLIQNHPYVDGNKRVAMLACLTFPDINGCDCTLTEDEWIGFVLAIAQGKLSKDESTEKIRKHCRFIDSLS